MIRIINLVVLGDEGGRLSRKLIVQVYDHLKLLSANRQNSYVTKTYLQTRHR